MEQKKQYQIKPLSKERIYLLQQAYKCCKGRSMEYTLQFMQDFTSSDLDEVIEYLQSFQNFTKNDTN